MRAFNNSQNSSSTGTRRSTSSCSYCNDPSHQVTSCPHVKNDWAYFQRFEIPCMDPANWTNNPIANAQGQRSWGTQTGQANWFKHPSGWSKWYAECEKAIGKIQQKELRDAKKANAKSKGKRAKSCGFCGDVGHNRRDCPTMQSINKRLIKANAHWRQRAYDYFVKELGFGNGALIKVSEEVGTWNNRETKTSVGIVTTVNWNELNMFCYTEQANRGWRGTKGKRVHENLCAPLQIKAVVNGKEQVVTWSKKVVTTNGYNNSFSIVFDTRGRELVDQFSNTWNTVTFDSVVSPTETPLSDEWLTQGQQECVDFITKKYSLAKLKDWGAISLLENYEKRHNLK
jgi:hypothetical protein